MVSDMTVTEKARRARATMHSRSFAAADSGALSRRADAGTRWDVTSLVRMSRWPRRVALALVYAPAAAIVLVGALAALGLLGDLWRLLRAFSTHALTSVPDTYERLALAARVTLVGGAFLALLCALVVVAVGCRGRRWWRLYLIPGVPLATVTALLFIFAVEWYAAAVNQRLGWPPVVWGSLAVLALGDAVVVAAGVGGIGAGPLGTRRKRLRGRLRTGREPEQPSARPSRQTRPIPVVRFGPYVTGVPAPESAALASPAGTSVPEAPEGVPTAEELRAAAESGPIPISHGRQESTSTTGASAV